jgi:rhodanese-related sulfurtransferase
MPTETTAPSPDPGAPLAPNLAQWETRPSPALLDAAREEGRRAGLPYAGVLEPEAAWLLFSRGDAVLVDVRTAEEWKFVGHVPGSHHAAWQTGTALIRNPRFLKELEQKAAKDRTILLLCRSGKRSAEAAAAATRAGFAGAYNVGEGFEGDKNESHQRGEAGGWRRRGLPWVQD